MTSGPLARDLMSSPMITVAPGMPLLEIQHLFIEAGISGAPVVDADGTVLGMISAYDLLVAVDQACDEDVDDAPKSVETAGRQGLRLPALLVAATARDLASPEIDWVSPETPAADIADDADSSNSPRARR